MEHSPYRAMAGPPRQTSSWRPFLDWTLVVFNAILCVGLAVSGASLGCGAHKVEAAAWTCVALPFPVLALFGLRAHGRRRLRPYLILPSGLQWIGVGVAFVFWSLADFGHAGHVDVNPGLDLAGEAIRWAMALLFVTAGVMTFESHLARMRGY